MWPFNRRAVKDEMRGTKKVRVNGFGFTIRKINPLLDFSVDKMPQIFTDFHSRRQRKEADQDAAAQARKAQADMYSIIEAGLVEPQLVKVGAGEDRGKEDGITVEDLFRDGDTGPKLYFEILAHSLNRFRGLRGAFFSIRLRYQLLTSWRNVTAQGQAPSPSPQETSA